MRISLFAALLACAAAATPLGAQVVHGRLVDAGSGAPVPAARVRLLQEGAAADSALTDTAGVFTVRSEEGGKFRLSAERVGYAESVSAEVEWADDDSVEVLFRIAADAVVLEPLEVVATTRRRGPWLDAFYRRAEERRFGYFITREQIDERRAMHTTDLLRRVPGLQIVPSRRIGYAVRGRGGCLPVVVLDGLRLGTASNLVDEWVSARDLEGIEVYNGPGQAPGEFAMYENGCAMIVLWTRNSS
jgi:hypothetical protein